jgi:hypothetical protein
VRFVYRRRPRISTKLVIRGIGLFIFPRPRLRPQPD